jgi:hypothetical protein
MAEQRISATLAQRVRLRTCRAGAGLDPSPPSSETTSEIVFPRDPQASRRHRGDGSPGRPFNVHVHDGAATDASLRLEGDHS